ncbi:27472_t:CDS:2, partial [Racocetra persica]
HIDSNTLSNSNTNPEDNDTSDESLSGDNISVNNTDDSNKTNDTDHSNNLNCSNKKPYTKIRKNSSWVWQHFRKRHLSQKWKTHENCTVIIKSKKVPNGQWKCEQITKPVKTIEVIGQPTITEMFHHAARQNTHQKESIDHALIISITIDNAANMIKAINLIGIEQISCTAHIIQLAIGKGLKPAEKRFLQIKHAIKLMEATMNADSDYNIHKNAIRPKSLMITKEE